MAIAEVAQVTPPPWLQAMGQAAGTVLLLELMSALLVVLALVVVLALAARWLYIHVTPILRQVTPPTQRAMAIAEKSSDKLVAGVAEFYGRRQQIETGIRVLLFGHEAAERLHESAIAQANTDLQAMLPLDHLPSPSNGYTPRIEAARQRETSQVDGVAAAVDSRASGQDSAQPPQPSAIIRPARAPRREASDTTRDGDYPNVDTLAGNAS